MGTAFVRVCFLCLSLWLCCGTASALVPNQNTAHDSVDLIEVNHYYNEHGRLVFDQIIFYEWSDTKARYDILAWRLLKRPSQLPIKDWKTGLYQAIWHDGSTLRHVVGKAFRESWTQYDPELRERDFLPKDERKELFRERTSVFLEPID